MRLTRYTDYALRILTYLALKPPGELATIKEIADRYGISTNHLMKIVHHLGQSGYIETVRGRGGGIALALAPDAIRLGDVVRLCEDDMRLVECFDAANNNCPISAMCVLPGILDEALGAFLGVLDRHTLEDLVAPSRALNAVLRPEAAG